MPSPRNFHFAIAFVACALVSGCNSTPQSTTPTATNNATTSAPQATMPRDDLGREVKLNAPAKRVAVIGPGAIETIYALGAGSVLVGRDAYADYPSEVKNVAVVGDFQGPSSEKTAAVRPDLVIVQGETYDRSRMDAWQKKIGVPTAQLSARNQESVAKGIEKIGAWLGKSEAAKQLAGELRGNRRTLSRPEQNWPTAFIEVGRSPLYTAGASTLTGDILTGASLQNVAKAVNGYKPFSAESLLARQPDVYVTTSEKPNLAQTVKELRAHPILKNLKCVKNGRVVVLNASQALRPGPRLGLAIEQLYNDCRKFGLY